MSPSVVLLK